MAENFLEGREGREGEDGCARCEGSDSMGYSCERAVLSIAGVGRVGPAADMAVERADNAQV